MSVSEVLVSRETLRANFRAFVRPAGGPSRVVPVLKANAYSHGMSTVAQALVGLTPRKFAVVHASEGLIHRRYFDGPVLVFSVWDRRELRAVQRWATAEPCAPNA